jgi:glycosyltransferase involved in cell wall biosynthesis
LKPLVSIVVPTRNSGNSLEKCLLSIHEQSYQNIETIVVDSKSIDDTLNILARMKYDVITTDWRLLGSRYVGFKASSGEYIVMLDSDQILEKSTIERCIALSEKYDMLCLQEVPYETKTLVERLCEADRRLIHKEFEVQNHPLYGALAPRFYSRNILEQAFSRIPESLFPFVTAREDAILYYEAWKISSKVWIVPNAIWHIEAKSVMELWRKNFNYGRSARQLQKQGYYKDLLKRKIRLRKSKDKISKDKFLSLCLLLLKGPPYFLGFYF